MSDCFVHASDLHLDAPLGSLGLLGEERRRELTRKAEAAWDNLVELCLEREASFLVLAGDVFDGTAAGLASQRRLHYGLGRLSEEGVRVFICHGNHDPLSTDFRSAFELPEEVVRFGSEAVETHEVALRRSGDPVCVSGVSFASRSESRNLARLFSELPPRRGRLCVVVMHTNLGGDPNHDDYAPCSVDDLSATEVDYWALGHIHKRRVIDLGSSRRAAYCGNLQGRSFKPSECEPKGALVVPVERGSFREPEFAACDEVRFIRHNAEVRPEESLGNVLEGIERLAARLGDAHGGRSVALRVRLVGRSSGDVCGELREHFADDGGWRKDSAWQEQLTKSLKGGGLCGVEVAVRGLADRDQLKTAGDLRAAVLEELDNLRAGGEGSEPLRDRLTELLPAASGLRQIWKENYSERIDDAADLAEELLLEVFSGGESP